MPTGKEGGGSGQDGTRRVGGRCGGTAQIKHQLIISCGVGGMSSRELPMPPSDATALAQVLVVMNSVRQLHRE